ncbi:hypothetical protein DNTS_032818 [Danionella cerebrum]|uniref:[histone H4]-lysine(20) N-methyltransferase n=1 Tax=Danionella cerebrum TaxID=2873325 RepID=A0A553QVN1_9TELE|nr:hypothetical protein DNTS_032818 [Danionella translucida]
MSGEILCNSGPPYQQLLKRISSGSESQHQESIPSRPVQDEDSSRSICNVTVPRTLSEVTVNGGALLISKPALNDQLSQPMHRSASFLSPSNDVTSCALRRLTCRKERAKRSTKKAAQRVVESRKVTDYFPIRRSSRKSKSELKCEEKQHIDMLITDGIEKGMMVRYIEGKGRGVFTTQLFQKGQFVVEYHGDLLQMEDARRREAAYAQDPNTGCYMYYFQYQSRTYCVDATRESGRLGRLINHSKSGNCQTRVHEISGLPHLILTASRDIQEGEELLYDYGDRSRASIQAHPWLKH